MTLKVLHCFTQGSVSTTSLRLVDCMDQFQDHLENVLQVIQTLGHYVFQDLVFVEATSHALIGMPTLAVHLLRCQLPHGVAHDGIAADLQDPCKGGVRMQPHVQTLQGVGALQLTAEILQVGEGRPFL